MLIDPITGNPSLAFTLFAAECEGDLLTEAGRRNRLIKTLRQRSIYEPISETIIREEAAAAGLTFLSDAEIRDIKEEI